MITIGKRIYMKAKKVVKILLGILIVVGIIFGYVQYKFYTVEYTVIKYLTAEKQISKESITSKPFIANLSGEKNWEVSIKIKGDPKTYAYYVNKQKKIVLESYVENGEVEILNKVMN